MSELIEHNASQALLTSLKELKEFVDANTVAVSTQATYRKPWQDFEGFCNHNGLMPLPADTGVVALFLYHLHKDKKYQRTTIQKVLSAINHKHIEAGFSSFSKTHPVRAVFNAIKRADDYRPKQVKPLRRQAFETLMAVIDQSTLTGMRDAALLSSLWFGAFRKSEVAAICVNDLVFDDNKGTLVTLGRNKVNQTGDRHLQVPLIFEPTYQYCPTSLLKQWLEQTDIESGPVFVAIKKCDRLQTDSLTPKAIDHVLAKHMKTAGLEGYSPHSFRAGFLTEAKLCGAPVEKLRQVSQHSSAALERYIRPGELLSKPAASYILTALDVINP